jgi:hypothetical protein
MTRDVLEMWTGLSTLLKVEHEVLNDLIELDYRDRPPIFTWIVVNNIDMVRKVLRADPEQANRALCVRAWKPIHLAAFLGRVDIMNVLVTEHGVDPNARAGGHSYFTPLHQAVVSRSIDGINGLLNLGAHIDAATLFQEMPYTALEIAVSASLVGRQEHKRWRGIISLLLSKGANYLRASGGEIQQNMS